MLRSLFRPDSVHLSASPNPSPDRRIGELIQKEKGAMRNGDGEIWFLGIGVGGGGEGDSDDPPSMISI